MHLAIACRVECLPSAAAGGHGLKLSNYSEIYLKMMSHVVASVTFRRSYCLTEAPACSTLWSVGGLDQSNATTMLICGSDYMQQQLLALTTRAASRSCHCINKLHQPPCTCRCTWSFLHTYTLHMYATGYRVKFCCMSCHTQRRSVRANSSSCCCRQIPPAGYDCVLICRHTGLLFSHEAWRHRQHRAAKQVVTLLVA